LRHNRRRLKLTVRPACEEIYRQHTLRIAER